MIAITRPVPASLSNCELTHLERAPIDVALAAEQHGAYEAALRAMGCRVLRLPDTPHLPDSVFVEDTAAIFDEVAIVTRPGAESRRAEIASVAPMLQRYRAVRRIEGPATLDGGDVLRVGRRVFVGVSSRTNEAGARQLGEVLEPLGYTVTAIPVRGCLHLKSAATAIAPDAVLCNPDWVDPGAFDRMATVEVDAAEPSAANVLEIGGSILCHASHRRTAGVLASRGYDVHPVDMSELAKAEGGVTCCSLIIHD